MNSSLKKSSIVQGMPKSRSMLVGNVGKSGYFIGLVNDAGNGANGFYTINTDSSDDIYLAGDAPSTRVAVTKITANPLTAPPAISWDRGYTSYNGRGIAIDSSGNYYSGSEDGNNSRTALIKFNSAGTVSWSRGITPQGTLINVLPASTGNVTAVINRPFNPGDGNNYINMCLMTFDTSGTYQWQRRYYKGSSPYYNAVPLGSFMDTSNNTYIAGYSILGGVNWDGILIKVDSSGGTSWQKYMAGTASDSVFIYNVTTDTASNVIGVGQISGTNSGSYIVKLDSAGATQWQRILTNYGPWTGAATDSSNNIYVAGQGNDPAVTGSLGLIAKYNSSGTLQWQRYLKSGSSGQPIYLSSMKLDSSGNICVAGQFYGTTGNQVGLVAKLAADGSGTGTYTIGSESITYGVATASGITPTYTNNNGTLTVATTGLSQSSVTYTLSNNTRTLTTSGVL